LSYVSFLYLLTAIFGQIAPPTVDAQADLTSWLGVVLGGEPYTSPAADGLVAAMRFKGTTDIPGVPAPMLVENGFTDNLFDAEQGLGLSSQALAASQHADVSLQLADTGHPGASNRTEVIKRLVDAGSAFLDSRLRGIGAGPAAGSVALSPMS